MDSRDTPCSFGQQVAEGGRPPVLGTAGTGRQAAWSMHSTLRMSAIRFNSRV